MEAGKASAFWGRDTADESVNHGLHRLRGDSFEFPVTNRLEAVPRAGTQRREAKTMLGSIPSVKSEKSVDGKQFRVAPGFNGNGSVSLACERSIFARVDFHRAEGLEQFRTGPISQKIGLFWRTESRPGTAVAPEVEKPQPVWPRGRRCHKILWFLAQKTLK